MTAFERNNGKIKTYKTTRRGQRVEVIEVLTTLERSKIEASKKLKEARLVSIAIALIVAIILTPLVLLVTCYSI